MGVKSTAKGSSNKKRSILVLSAHSDDFVLGAGGTIAKLVQEGVKVHCFIFSYGEQSHPWLKTKEVKKMRAKESFKAAEVLGCSVEFFDLLEFKFIEGIKEQNVIKKIKAHILKEKPCKIFTHSNEDPHPDHQSVHKITKMVYDELKAAEKPDLYVFSVWNPVELKTRFPCIKVDISKTFSLKVESLDQFPSQIVHVLYPRFLIYFRAINEGLKMGKRFGEKFYKVG